MDDLAYSQGEDSEVVQVVYGDEDEVQHVDNESQDERSALERRRRFAYDATNMRAGGRNGSLLAGSDSPRSLHHLQHHALADQIHSLANNIAGSSDDRRSLPGPDQSPGFASPMLQAPPRASTSPQAFPQQSPAPHLTAASQSLGPRGVPAAAAAANHPTSGLALQSGIAIDEDLFQAFQSHRPVTSPNASHRYQRGGRGRGGAAQHTPGIRAAGGGVGHTPGGVRPNPYASLLANSGGGSGRGRGRQATPRTGRGRGGGRGNERQPSRFRQPQLGTEAGTPGQPTAFHGASMLNTAGEAILSSGDEEEEEVGAQVDAAAAGGVGTQNNNNNVATPLGGHHHQQHYLTETPNPGYSGGGTGGAIQRDFLATLAPPPSRTTLSKAGRGRAGTGSGLLGRLHNAISREKAIAASQGRNRGLGTPLTILEKRVQASVPKCHCKCDAGSVFSGGVGVREVVAVFTARSALGVDMQPGSVILVYPPWRVTQNPESAEVPLMMCCGDVSYGAE